jgi:hypothetical protein
MQRSGSAEELDHGGDSIPISAHHLVTGIRRRGAEFGVLSPSPYLLPLTPASASGGFASFGSSDIQTRGFRYD